MSLSRNNDLILLVFHIMKMLHESPMNDVSFLKNLRDRFSFLAQNGNLTLTVGFSSGFSKRLGGIICSKLDNLKPFITSSMNPIGKPAFLYLAKSRRN